MARSPNRLCRTPHRLSTLVALLASAVGSSASDEGGEPLHTLALRISSFPSVVCADILRVVPATSSTCPAACDGVGHGYRVAALQRLDAASASFSFPCAANILGFGPVPGHQRGGRDTCTVSWVGGVSTFDDFSCVCIRPGTQLGLAPPNLSFPRPSCATACTSTSDALRGHPVRVTSRHAELHFCVPSHAQGGSLDTAAALLRSVD